MNPSDLVSQFSIYSLKGDSLALSTHVFSTSALLRSICIWNEELFKGLMMWKTQQPTCWAQKKTYIRDDDVISDNDLQFTVSLDFFFLFKYIYA